jgi:chemosensory pili system protein ChpC
VLARVRLNENDAMVPDLAALEQHLHAALAAAA